MGTEFWQLYDHIINQSANLTASNMFNHPWIFLKDDTVTARTGLPASEAGSISHIEEAFRGHEGTRARTLCKVSKRYACAFSNEVTKHHKPFDQMLINMQGLCELGVPHQCYTMHC